MLNMTYGILLLARSSRHKIFQYICISACMYATYMYARLYLRLCRFGEFWPIGKATTAFITTRRLETQNMLAPNNFANIFTPLSLSKFFSRYNIHSLYLVSISSFLFPPFGYGFDDKRVSFSIFHEKWLCWSLRSVFISLRLIITTAIVNINMAVW